MAILFRLDVASTPRSPSTETTKGENCLLCLRHASKYIRFFALSENYRQFSRGFNKWDLASVFTTCILWTLSVPFFQMFQIRRWPLCYVDSGGGALSWMVLPVVLARFAFGFFTAQPANMRGSLRMWEGVNALLDKFTPPSRISLWRAVTRPPLLQSRAWQMENLVLHPSQ